MNNNLKYLPINTGVRPAKVVILVNINSEYWESDCLAILAMFNRTWGGDYHLIVPTDGNTIAPSFLDIMSKYDPDYIYYYVSSVHQLKLFDSPQFEKFVEKFINESPVTNQPLTIEKLEKRSDFLSMTISDFQISEQLMDTLQKNLLLFSNQPKEIILPFKYDERISYPLTDMKDIIKYSGIENVVALKYSEPTLLTSLLLHSNFGLVDPYLEEVLRTENISLKYNKVKYEQDLYWLLDSIYDLNNTFNRRSYGFKIPSIHIEYYINLDVNTEQYDPIMILGNTLSDFCLYYCLSRINNQVFWLPTHSEFNEEVHHIINSKRQLTRYFNKINLVSTSLNAEDIEKIMGAMEAIEAKKQIPSEMLPYAIKESIHYLLKNILYTYCKDNDINEQVLLFDTETNQSIYPIDTPIPLYFSKVLPYGHFWITDIFVKDIIFPKNQNLVNELLTVRHYNSRNIRITNKGVSYFSPNYIYVSAMGENIKLTKVNPNFKLPNTYNLFEKLFQASGYFIKNSDKGNFEKVFIDKFDGLDNLAETLLSDGYRGILNKFIDKSKNQTGNYTNGVVVNQRRHLDYDTIFEIIKDTDLVSNIINNLLEKGVIERGFIFKCHSCRNADWYDISVVSNTFKCTRCDKVQNYTPDTLQLQSDLNRVQPIWYYKLNEMIYQAYLNNSLVPILTLAKLKRLSTTSFDYIPEIELRQDKQSSKPDMEIDICCVVDGDIIIGECKNATSLKDNKKNTDEIVVKKYIRLAEKVQAHKVVFSTICQWSEGTLTVLKKYQSNTKNIEIVILQNEDIDSRSSFM
ncbi:hypothetical protein ACQKNS_24460 [Peribacillus sp. NPDC094092]|uniref:hypothetical protein n=1 Tax=Peribacillus sp. NPDC094092 TaxID=3390611 RepID=UPI003D08511E